MNEFYIWFGGFSIGVCSSFLFFNFSIRRLIEKTGNSEIIDGLLTGSYHVDEMTVSRVVPTVDAERVIMLKKKNSV